MKSRLAISMHTTSWIDRSWRAYRKYKSWIPRIGHSIIDQGLFSGGNFILNLWLLHSLSADGYGRFAIAFSLFLLLSGVHNSFVLEPISILGTSVVEDDLPIYTGMIGWLHLIVCMIISALTLITLNFLPPMSIGLIITVMAVLFPFSLLYWLLRRLSYLLSVPGTASSGSGAHFVTLMVAVYALSATNKLSETTALGATALASIVASLVVMWRLPVKPRYRLSRGCRADFRTLITDHWLLGRWVALQTIFTIGSTHLPVFIAGAGLNVAAAGLLRALGLVVMPLQQVILAIGGMLVLPVLSREYGRGNMPTVRKKTNLLTLGFIGLACGYLLVLVVLRHIIGDFMPHDGERASDWLIPAMGVSALIGAVGGGAGLALRATRRVTYYPLSTAIPAIYGIAMTPLMILHWGITGAVINGILGSIVGCALNSILYRRWI